MPAFLQPLGQHQRTPPGGLVTAQGANQLVKLPVVQGARWDCVRGWQGHWRTGVCEPQQLLWQRVVAAAAGLLAAAVLCVLEQWVRAACCCVAACWVAGDWEFCW